MRILFVFGFLLPFSILAQQDTLLSKSNNYASIFVTDRFIFNEGSFLHRLIFFPQKVTSVLIPNEAELRLGASFFVYKDMIELKGSYPIQRAAAFNGSWFADTSLYLKTATSLGCTLYPFGVRKYRNFPKFGIVLNQISMNGNSKISSAISLGTVFRYKTNLLEFDLLYVLNNKMPSLYNSKFQRFWLDIGLKSILSFRQLEEESGKSTSKNHFYIISGVGTELTKDSLWKEYKLFNPSLEFSIGFNVIKKLRLQLTSILLPKTLGRENTSAFLFEIQRSFLNRKSVNPFFGTSFGVGNIGKYSFFSTVGLSCGFHKPLTNRLSYQASFKYLLKIEDFNNSYSYSINPLQLYWSL